MLQLNNGTPFLGTLFLAADPDGIDSLYAIIKGTFQLDAKMGIADKQVPIIAKDEYLGEPGKSSLKMATDIGLTKPGTDILLVGNAYAPEGQPVPQTDVTLNVGPVKKTVQVFGDRTWKSGVLSASFSKPEPFTKMPLQWERAFGGIDQTGAEKPEIFAENRNPVGTGFHVKNGQKKVDGMKLPNVEDPKQLISSLRDRPTPSGFGPICPHWEPRRSFAGTYDEAWTKKRAPYLPKDFDSRFLQTAPADQIVAGFLKGGEPVEVLGATPSGSLRFSLPSDQIQVTYKADSESHVRPANPDTIIIDPEESRLVLVWRAVFPCDKKALRISEVKLDRRTEV